MRAWRWLWFAVGPALPAQLLTTDAGVMSPALVGVKERIEWIERDYADELRATTFLTTSPTRWLQLEVAVPYLWRDGEVPPATGGGHAGHGPTTLRDEQSGLGDIELAAKWAVLREDDVMRSHRVSLLGNLTLPTGDDDGRFDGFDLGPHAALGLGAYGGAVGLGYTWVHDRHRAAVALRGWTFGENDTRSRAGEQLTFDAAYWFRLSPAVFEARTETAELRGVVELRGLWREDDVRRGIDLNDGGSQWNVLLGLQAFATRATSFELGVVLPIEDTTLGAFGELRRGYLFSFRILF
jgi:hypothetical protein